MGHCPASTNRDHIKPPTSSYSLGRTYQREDERQRKMVLKAEHANQRLLLVQGLKKLFADEHLMNLLRAEGLDTLPKYLAERINTLGTVAKPMPPGMRRSHLMKPAMNPVRVNPRSTPDRDVPRHQPVQARRGRPRRPQPADRPLNTFLGFKQFRPDVTRILRNMKAAR